MFLRQKSRAFRAVGLDVIKLWKGFTDKWVEWKHVVLRFKLLKDTSLLRPSNFSKPMPRRPGLLDHKCFRRDTRLKAKMLSVVHFIIFLYLQAVEDFGWPRRVGLAMWQTVLAKKVLKEYVALSSNLVDPWIPMIDGCHIIQLFFPNPFRQDMHFSVDRRFEKGSKHQLGMILRTLGMEYMEADYLNKNLNDWHSLSLRNLRSLHRSQEDSSELRRAEVDFEAAHERVRETWSMKNHRRSLGSWEVWDSHH